MFFFHFSVEYYIIYHKELYSVDILTSMLFSNGPNKAFLVPDSCRATERNGNSIRADLTENTTENN
jgi:hypothetical protein